MTDYALPAAGALVELTTSDEAPLSNVLVVAAEDAEVTLSISLATLPEVGERVTLRWGAGPRGRYALDGAIQSVDETRVVVAATAAPQLEQNRNYVRGGGGEHVLLHRRGEPDAVGWIRDLSEQGIRAHFADADLTEGAEIHLSIHLDRDVVEMTAVTVKVASLRQTVPQRGPMSVEVVAVLYPDEVQAQVIRRYVLRQQMLARARE